MLSAGIFMARAFMRSCAGGVEARVAAAVFTGHGHFLAELGEDFPAFGVDGALVVLDLRPSGMP